MSESCATVGKRAERVEVETDPRHAELLIPILVCSRAVKEWTHQESVRETVHAQSNFHHKIPHHKVPMSWNLWYLLDDRIQFASKERARAMAEPIRVDIEILKRRIRFLLKWNPRYIWSCERQEIVFKKVTCCSESNFVGYFYRNWSSQWFEILEWCCTGRVSRRRGSGVMWHQDDSQDRTIECRIFKRPSHFAKFFCQSVRCFFFGVDSKEEHCTTDAQLLSVAASQRVQCLWSSFSFSCCVANGMGSWFGRVSTESLTVPQNRNTTVFLIPLI